MIDDLKTEAAPPAPSALRPRFQWWRNNWPHVGPWLAAIVSILVAAGSAAGLLIATNNNYRRDLIATHDSYQDTLIALESSIRDDVRALRSSTNEQIVELRERIERHEHSEDHSPRRPKH